MKNRLSSKALILVTIAMLAIGCQKEHGFDYAELVDGVTFNKFIPATATSLVFEYNQFVTGDRILLSTPASPVPIYGHLDGKVWHVTTSASTIYANPRCDKMFNCPRLTSIEFGDGFNTLNVTDMRGMFQGCSKLTILDVSNFNTSNVVTMSRTVDTVLEYYTATGYSQPHQIPRNNVLIRFGMFAGCSSLTSLDLSSFNTSKVTDMRGLFEGCKNLTSLNVSGLNTSNVKYMDAMFKGCSSLTSLDLSNFNTSNVVSMGTVYRYFYNSGSAGQYGRTVYLTNGGMFENCTSLTNLDLSNFNTTNVARMYNMFENCTHMTYLNLSNFDMSNLEVTVYDQVWHFTGKGDMCWNLSVSSGNCTIVCTESVQNSLLNGTSIPVDQVVFTWVRP